MRTVATVQHKHKADLMAHIWLRPHHT